MAREEVRTIRYDSVALRRAIDQLDEHSATEAGQHSNVRESDRFEYRVRALTVEFLDQSGSWIKHALPSRNLSRFGCSVLSGSYIYPKTRCRVQLVSLYNHAQSVSATVARCRYLQGTGRVYEVGIRFDQAIDIALFHRGASFHRILLVDDDPLIHKIVPKLLSALNVEIVSARNGVEALEAAKSDSFDLVLMDLSMPEKDGVTTTMELRERGYSRPIAALTADDNAEAKQKCLEAGFSQVLVKPLYRESLTDLVKSMIAEPLVSSLVHDSSMASLIDDYVHSLPEQIRGLERSFAAKDIKALGDIAKDIKGAAGTHGFDMISAAAEALDTACREGKDTAEIRRILSEVTRLCYAARPVQVLDHHANDLSAGAPRPDDAPPT